MYLRLLLIMHMLVAVVPALLLTLGTTLVGPTETERTSDGPLTVDLLAQFGGQATSMALQEHHLIAGMGRRLLVIDIADPEAPRVVGQSEQMPALVEMVRLGGDYALKALRGRGLRVIDLTDVTRPRTAGTLADPRGGPQLNDLRVENNYGFGYYSSQLDVIDLWDREHPRFYGQYRNEQEDYQSLAVSDGYAYLGARKLGESTTGLRIVDLRSPARPIGVKFLPLTREIQKVAIAGRYAYLYGYGGSLIFYVIDVGDPTNPQLVGQVALNRSIHVTSSFSELAVHKGHLFFVTGLGMIVIDVRDPTAPRVVDDLDRALSGNYAAIAGDWAFVTRVPTGERFNNFPIRVIDIEEPELPTLRLTYSFPNSGAAYAVNGSGNRVYSLSHSSDDALGWLRVFDVADPRAPRMLGELDLPLALDDLVVTEQRRVFVRSSRGLLAMDVDDPTQLRIAGAIETYGSLADLVVREPIGYVADGEAGLTVLDLADPRHMDVLASLPLPHVAQDVVVVGDHAFVLDALVTCRPPAPCSPRRLTAVDVSNPRRPRVVGWLANAAPPGANARSQVMASVDTYVYVIDRNLNVLDVHDPRRMTPLSISEVSSTIPGGVTIDQPFMITSGSRGDLDFFSPYVMVHDVSIPALPQWLLTWQPDGGAYDVWSHDGQIALAAGAQGLQVLRLATPTALGAPAATPTAMSTPSVDATATPTVGIRVLPATPEFTPFPSPRRDR